MLIDCDTCEVRGLACGDCVVSVLLGPPPELELDASEQEALDVLAGSGLVPPLRLVPPRWAEPMPDHRPSTHPHEHEHGRRLGAVADGA